MTIDSSENVGIKNTTMASFSNLPATDLVVGAGSADSGITIYSGTSSGSNIGFADATSGDGRNQGIVQYHHNGDYMRFFTNASERMRIASDGSIQFHNTPPIKTFDFGTTSNVTLADGAHIEFTSTSGVWFVTEQSQTGLSAILLAGGGQTAVASQIGSSYTNSSSSGSFRFYRPSGQGYYFKNDQGNSCSFGICHMSLRNSN